MYKIINGKRYGTETGVFIANWSNGLGGDDPERVFEALYKIGRASCRARG